MSFLSNLRIAADNGQYAIKQLVADPVTFVQTIKRYTWPEVKKILAEGIQVTDAAEYERRLDICYTCDELMNKDTEFVRCQKCGCSISWKGKLKTAGCPLNKWGETVPEVLKQALEQVVNEAKPEEKK